MTCNFFSISKFNIQRAKTLVTDLSICFQIACISTTCNFFSISKFNIQRAKTYSFVIPSSKQKHTTGSLTHTHTHTHAQAHARAHTHKLANGYLTGSDFVCEIPTLRVIKKQQQKDEPNQCGLVFFSDCLLWSTAPISRYFLTSIVCQARLKLKANPWRRMVDDLYLLKSLLKILFSHIKWRLMKWCSFLILGFPKPHWCQLYLF